MKRTDDSAVINLLKILLTLSMTRSRNHYIINIIRQVSSHWLDGPFWLSGFFLRALPHAMTRI